MRYRIFGDDVVGLFTALSLSMRAPKADIENGGEPIVKLYGSYAPRLKEPGRITLSDANRRHIGKLLRHYYLRPDTKFHIPKHLDRSKLEALLRLLWRFAGNSIEVPPAKFPDSFQGVRHILTPASLPTVMQKNVSNHTIHRSTYHAFSYFISNEHTAENAFYADKQPNSPLENVTVLKNIKTGQTQVSLHYPSAESLEERQKTTLLNQGSWLTGEALRRARLAPYIIISGDKEHMNHQLCSLDSYSVARIYDEASKRYIPGLDILGLTPELNPNQAFNAARLFFRPKRSNFHLEFPELAASPDKNHGIRIDERFATTLAHTVSGLVWFGSIGGILLVLAAAQLFHLTMIPAPFTIAVLLTALAFTLTCLFLLATGKTEIWYDKLLGIDDGLELVELHKFAKAEPQQDILSQGDGLEDESTLSGQIDNILQGWNKSKADTSKKVGFWQPGHPSSETPVPHTIKLLGSTS